jgi:hypothetical protein
MCSAIAAVLVYTIAVVLNRFVHKTAESWISAALLAVGYLVFVPSEFLVMYSRYGIHLLARATLISRIDYVC